MKFLPILAVTALLFSCSPIKFAQINSDKLTANTGAYVFENDTVKITYHFWENKGRMSYDIYNKLDKPIYVDWKTSAFIPNNQMISYYRDETNAEIVSSSYYALGKYSGGSSSYGKTKATHQERVAVIPPMSQITQKDYNLTKSYSDISSGTFTASNSPLSFRNYISISTNEKFEGNPLYINNSFYVSKVSKAKEGKMYKLKSDNAFYAYKGYGDPYGK